MQDDSRLNICHQPDIILWCFTRFRDRDIVVASEGIEGNVARADWKQHG